MKVTAGPVTLAGPAITGGGSPSFMFPGAPGHYILVWIDQTNSTQYFYYGAVFDSSLALISPPAVWFVQELQFSGPHISPPDLIPIPGADMLLAVYTGYMTTDGGLSVSGPLYPAQAVFRGNAVAIGPDCPHDAGISPCQLDFSAYPAPYPIADAAGDPSQPDPGFTNPFAAAAFDSGRAAVFINSRGGGFGTGQSDGFFMCSIDSLVGLTVAGWVPVTAWDTPPSDPHLPLPNAPRIDGVRSVSRSGGAVVGWAQGGGVTVWPDGSSSRYAFSGSFPGDSTYITYDMNLVPWFTDSISALWRFDGSTTPISAVVTGNFPGWTNFFSAGFGMEMGGFDTAGTVLFIPSFEQSVKWHVLASSCQDADASVPVFSPPINAPTYPPPTWVWSDPVGGSLEQLFNEGTVGPAEPDDLGVVLWLLSTTEAVLAVSSNVTNQTVLYRIAKAAQPPDLPLIVRDRSSRVAYAVNRQSDIFGREFSATWGFWANNEFIQNNRLASNIPSWDGVLVDYYDSTINTIQLVVPASSAGYMFIGSTAWPNAPFPQEFAFPPTSPLFGVSYDSWWGAIEGPFEDDTLRFLSGNIKDRNALRWRVHLECPAEGVKTISGGSHIVSWNFAYGDMDLDDLIVDIWLADPITRVPPYQRVFPRDDNLGVTPGFVGPLQPSSQQRSTRVGPEGSYQ